MLALGATDGIANSGISEQIIQSRIEAAMDSGHHLDAADLVPSSIGLAVIALSAFMDKSLALEERGTEFGDRAAKASVAGVAAKAALITTNMWWLALVAGVGSRWLATHGGNKRQRYEMLETAVISLESDVRQGGVIHANVLRLT